MIRVILSAKLAHKPLLFCVTQRACDLRTYESASTGGVKSQARNSIVGAGRGAAETRGRQRQFAGPANQRRAQRLRMGSLCTLRGEGGMRQAPSLAWPYGPAHFPPPYRERDCGGGAWWVLGARRRPLAPCGVRWRLAASVGALRRPSAPCGARVGGQGRRGLAPNDDARWRPVGRRALAPCGTTRAGALWDDARVWVG